MRQIWLNEQNEQVGFPPRGVSAAAVWGGCVAPTLTAAGPGARRLAGSHLPFFAAPGTDCPGGRYGELRSDLAFWAAWLAPGGPRYRRARGCL